MTLHWSSSTQLGSLRPGYRVPSPPESQKQVSQTLCELSGSDPDPFFMCRVTQAGVRLHKAYIAPRKRAATCSYYDWSSVSGSVELTGWTGIYLMVSMVVSTYDGFGMRRHPRRGPHQYAVDRRFNWALKMFVWRLVASCACNPFLRWI